MDYRESQTPSPQPSPQRGEGVPAEFAARLRHDSGDGAATLVMWRMADKFNKLKARLPRGLADRGPAEIAATRRMIEAIRAVYERYGFDPVETPDDRIHRRARQIPARPGPAERRRVLVPGRRRAVAELALRSDRAARALRRREFPEHRAAVSQLSVRLGVPQREAGPRPLPPVHAVRRRHGGLGVHGRRRRDLHDGGGHDGGAGHSARPVRGEGKQSQDARWRHGSPSVSAAKRMRASDSPCCVRSTSSIGLARTVLALCSEKGGKMKAVTSRKVLA